MAYQPPVRFGLGPPRPVVPTPGMLSGPPPNIASATISRPPRPNLPAGQVPPKDTATEKPPVTTVFVGSISEKAPDTMMRTLLQRCGNIVNWKRVQGADGKLQAFGFCEFEVPEATLRCIRLLNDWPIAEKKLVVKVDDKTKTMLESWEKEHASSEEDIKREDQLALASLDAVMKEFANELRRALPQQSTKPSRDTYGPVSSGPKADEGLDDIVEDEDAKNLINREINRFRTAYKDDEVVTEIKPTGRDRRAEEKERGSSERRERRDGERDRTRGGDRGSERGGSSRSDRGSTRDGRGARSDRAREGSANREERTSRRRTRSRSPSTTSSHRQGGRGDGAGADDEDPDARYERLRLERQLRDKEQAYQERLKNWEVRERKKIREFERERQRSEERRQEEKKEARRLREFLEDYDDERDDHKYYKSNALTRRTREREKEAEADNRDRLKEKEEIEELRKKLTEEGHPDPETEISRRQNPQLYQQEQEQQAAAANGRREEEAGEEEERRRSSRDNRMSPEQHHHRGQAAYSDSDDRNGSRHSVTQHSLPPHHVQHRDSPDSSAAGNHHHHHHQQQSDTPNSQDQHSMDSKGRKRLSVRDVFNNEDDESHDEVKRKRPLVPLDYEDERKRGASGHRPSTIDDKRTAIKRLIDRIPTDKYELFSWSMDWDQLDQQLLDNRIKPWVNRKITDYIGEEEPTLTEFICQKVMGRSSAASILTDVAMVLDDEAETFVVKMWRLLVYETEAKKAGLGSKN